jgi:hypothetical protein
VGESLDVETGKKVKEFAVPQPYQTSAKESVGKPEIPRSIAGPKHTPVWRAPYWTEVRLWRDLLIARAGKWLIAVDEKPSYATNSGCRAETHPLRLGGSNGCRNRGQ